MNPNQIIEIETFNIPLPRRMTPKTGYYLEDFVQRNFNVEDRVKIDFKKQIYDGTVQKKYKKNDCAAPFILIKTDKQVDTDPDAFLNGFGIEISVDNVRTIFYDEPTKPYFGDPIYSKQIRGKKARNDLPF